MLLSESEADDPDHGGRAVIRFERREHHVSNVDRLAFAPPF
jgi:hypothetical protein